jgi:hypothetical protein
MNLIINKVCNRSCSYCFAKRKIDTDDCLARSEGDISLENVKIYLDFLERSYNGVCKILGGEPTIHPEFPRILDLALERGFEVVVFTNGMWNNSVCSYVQALGTPRISFVVNVNEPRYWSKVESDRQNNCLEVIGGRGSISFNLFEKDFDLTFSADLIDKHGLRRTLRLGLASPIVGMQNHHIGADDRLHVGTRLLDQLGVLEQRNILGQPDCGFIYCMFPEDRWGETVRVFGKGLTSICQPILDVGSDLSVWSCFPLSGVNNVFLSDFTDIKALQNHYNKQLSPFREMGTTENCIDCTYGKREQCCRGCVAHTIRSFMKDDPSLFEKLQ